MDGRAEVSLVRLLRLSDAPPPAREVLDVADDGSFTAWRSIHDAVGRFAGSVPDLERLRGLVEAVSGDRPPGVGELPLDATVDSLEAGGHELEVSANASVDGPWGELLAVCREQLEGVGSSPVAAVALVIEGPGALRLEHRGTEPFPIELANLSVEVTRWRGDTPVGSSERSVPGLGRVEAGPGWTLAVELEGGPATGEPRDLLTASASFVAEDAGVYVPVVVSGRASAG
jgi:hypothetical protein